MGGRKCEKRRQGGTEIHRHSLMPNGCQALIGDEWDRQPAENDLDRQAVMIVEATERG